MTTVCAIKIELPIEEDTLYVVMFGNKQAQARDVRVVGEIEPADAALSKEQQQTMTNTFVRAADRFRAEMMQLLSERSG